MALQKTSDYAVGDTNFTAFMNSLDSQRRGDFNISLSEYNTDAAPAVQVGSWFENNGALYEVITGAETPTGYSGISASTVFFLYFDVSAEAFVYDATTPTWSDAKQGWYHPTNTNDRALYTMYKDSGSTLYQYKKLMESVSKDIYEESYEETKLITTTPFIFPRGRYCVYWPDSTGTAIIQIDMQRKSPSTLWLTVAHNNVSANDEVSGFSFYSDGENFRILRGAGTDTNVTWRYSAK